MKLVSKIIRYKREKGIAQLIKVGFIVLVEVLVEKQHEFRKKVLSTFKKNILIFIFKLIGPPQILTFTSKTNKAILKAFGAHIGKNRILIFPPITLLGTRKYSNLTINDDCTIHGNIFLDLTCRITLEKGVSLGPGVIIMTHNDYNYNSFLKATLA